MRPFGETVLAWRLFRQMTQADLALAARLPRPNLSAIERGEREVTLKTLRSLALALDVRPGILVDGICPDADAPPLGRQAIERIARVAAGRGSTSNHREADLARLLQQSMSALLSERHGRRSPGARADRAYFSLRSRVPMSTVASLIKKVSEQLDAVDLRPPTLRRRVRTERARPSSG